MKRSLALFVLLIVLLAGCVQAVPTPDAETVYRVEIVNQEQLGEDLLVGTRGTTNFDTLAVDTLTAADVTASDDLTVTDDATITGLLSVAYGEENFGIPSVITATVPYTPATGTVATIGDGELWLVHDVFCRIDTNFDCTGDNCTLTIGDGNDADGFIVAADANLQTTFTEATGYTAGWYGIENGSNGAYTVDDGGPFVYAPSGAAETIDYAVGGTDPAAGSATCFVIYTRIE